MIIYNALDSSEDVSLNLGTTLIVVELSKPKTMSLSVAVQKIYESWRHQACVWEQWEEQEKSLQRDNWGVISNLFDANLVFYGLGN